MVGSGKHNKPLVSIKGHFYANTAAYIKRGGGGVLLHGLCLGFTIRVKLTPIIQNTATFDGSVTTGRVSCIYE